MRADFEDFSVNYLFRDENVKECPLRTSFGQCRMNFVYNCGEEEEVTEFGWTETVPTVRRCPFYHWAGKLVEEL